MHYVPASDKNSVYSYHSANHAPQSVSSWATQVSSSHSPSTIHYSPKVDVLLHPDLGRISSPMPRGATPQSRRSHHAPLIQAHPLLLSPSPHLYVDLALPPSPTTVRISPGVDMNTCAFFSPGPPSVLTITIILPAIPFDWTLRLPYSSSATLHAFLNAIHAHLAHAVPQSEYQLLSPPAQKAARDSYTRRAKFDTSASQVGLNRLDCLGKSVFAGLIAVSDGTWELRVC